MCSINLPNDCNFPHRPEIHANNFANNLLFRNCGYPTVHRRAIGNASIESISKVLHIDKLPLIFDFPIRDGSVLGREWLGRHHV